MLKGIDAEYVSLENIVTACTEDDEETLGQEFYDRVAVAVGERIRQCGPRVPVVTGTYTLFSLSVPCNPN
jgi:aspartate kinase